MDFPVSKHIQKKNHFFSAASVSFRFFESLNKTQSDLSKAHVPSSPSDNRCKVSNSFFFCFDKSCIMQGVWGFFSENTRVRLVQQKKPRVYETAIATRQILFKMKTKVNDHSRFHTLRFLDTLTAQDFVL